MTAGRRIRRLLDRALNLVLAHLARPVPAAAPAAAERSVLFVCLGNVCRSPLAEAALRGKLTAVGLDKRVTVDSAGTSSFNAGRPPDWRARWTARRHGLSLGGLRARQLEPADFDRFDVIVAMDDSVEEAVARAARAAGRAPGSTSIRRLTGGVEVADPVEGTLADFEAAYRTIDRAADKLVLELDAALRGGQGA